MRLLVFLMAATLPAIGFLQPATAQTEWKSAHISITKFATWAAFLDGLDHPHIDVTIHNDGTEPVGTVDFLCKLILLDRATPIFEDGWSTDLDRVIRPGESQTLNLKPNMFSDLANAIEHRYENASWSCFVNRVLTASGQTVTFEPGQLPTEGPPFGVGYMPVPDAMAPLLKVPQGSGMWIAKVLPQSTAAAVGVQAGDVVLTIDSKPLRVITDLPNALKEARAAGRTARLEVVRAGQPIEILVPENDPELNGVYSATGQARTTPGAQGRKP